MSPRPLIVCAWILLAPCALAASQPPAEQGPKFHVWDAPVTLHGEQRCVRYTDPLQSGERVLVVHDPKCAPAASPAGKVVIRLWPDDKSPALCAESPWGQSDEINGWTPGFITGHYAEPNHWFTAKNVFSPYGQPLTVSKEQIPVDADGQPVQFPDLSALAAQTIGACSQFIDTNEGLEGLKNKSKSASPNDTPPVTAPPKDASPPQIDLAEIRQAMTAAVASLESRLSDLYTLLKKLSDQIVSIQHDPPPRDPLWWIGWAGTLALGLVIVALLGTLLYRLGRVRDQLDSSNPRDGGAGRPSQAFDDLKRWMIGPQADTSRGLLAELDNRLRDSTRQATLAVSDWVADARDALRGHLSWLGEISGADLGEARAQAEAGKVRAALDGARAQLTNRVSRTPNGMDGPDRFAQALQPLLAREISEYLSREGNWAKENTGLRESIRELEVGQDHNRKQLQTQKTLLSILLTNYFGGRPSELDDAGKAFIVYLSKEPEPWAQCRETLRGLWLILNEPENQARAGDWFRAAGLADVRKALNDESPFLIGESIAPPADPMQGLRAYFCKRWTNLLFPIFRSDALLRAYFPPDGSGTDPVGAQATAIPSALSAAVARLRELMRRVDLLPDAVDLLQPPGPEAQTATQAATSLPLELTDCPQYADCVSRAVQEQGREVAVYVNHWHMAGCDDHGQTTLVVRDRS